MRVTPFIGLATLGFGTREMAFDRPHTRGPLSLEKSALRLSWYSDTARLKYDSS